MVVIRDFGHGLRSLKAMRDAGLMFISTIAEHGLTLQSSSASVPARKAVVSRADENEKTKASTVDPDAVKSLDPDVFPVWSKYVTAAGESRMEAVEVDNGTASAIPSQCPLSLPELSTIVDLSARLCTRKNMELGRGDMRRYLAAALVSWCAGEFVILGRHGEMITPHGHEKCIMDPAVVHKRVSNCFTLPHVNLMCFLHVRLKSVLATLVQVVNCAPDMCVQPNPFDS